MAAKIKPTVLGTSAKGVGGANPSRQAAATQYFRATANTGNTLIVFPDGMSSKEAVKTLGLPKGNTLTSFEFAGASAGPALGNEVEAIVFDRVGAACIDSQAFDKARAAIEANSGNGGFIVEPERYVRAIGMMSGYLKGYQDGVDDVSRRLLGQVDPGLIGSIASAAKLDEMLATWGLQKTQVLKSRWTGKGIRIAVLDTGFATQHPDFVGRKVTTKVFTGEASVEDVQGHGTHCIGTAGGSAKPGSGSPRYGIACEADIYAGKVLNNGGSGGDRGIIAGIEWAVLNQCPIVSMSLGAPVYAPGYSAIFETIARRALAAGTLIIAAAGNDSYRQNNNDNQTIAPVEHPANCPSIMAVGAVDSDMLMAYFSNGGIYGDGGEVDIVGPGVNILSSWPPSLGKAYHTISGTSMATPHVAGIAALLAQSDPKLRGRALWDGVIALAKKLPLPPSDAGAGLVQAP